MFFIYFFLNICTTFSPVQFSCDWKITVLVGQLVLLSCRNQRYSSTYTPHNSERQRERQRGLVKQTFELDEAAAADRQDDQVADGDDHRTLFHTHDNSVLSKRHQWHIVLVIFIKIIRWTLFFMEASVFVMFLHSFIQAFPFICYLSVYCPLSIT